jgi:F-type H+-transporting ATPase subunit gamma|tara:strand:- start:4236 stop:5114 length:879 start_codon:yes stop_codon:yes gene_type:complete
MPSLKDLKIRINTVKSTQKITSAMKMVASAKLKKAQEKAESGRPYASKMSNIVSTLALKVNKESGPKLLFGNSANKNILVVAISADRGLCGGFNNNISKEVRRRVKELENEGKTVKLILVGRKVGTVLKREMGQRIIGSFSSIQGDSLSFSKVSPITLQILSLFEENSIDQVEMFYNHFKSVISQVVTKKQLIPAEINEEKVEETNEQTTYEYEPEEEIILNDLLPRNLSTQIYSALLDSSAGELAARMTAMDNATRNAGDLIDRLTLEYNRTRQAFITKELIEIISGAEAV